MATYHIHISGMVQGVGFRPFVNKLAKSLGLTGWVSNTSNGVHIRYNANENTSKQFCAAIINDPPPNALITSHQIEIILPEMFDEFTIRQNYKTSKSPLLLTPDIAICEDCKKELFDPGNRRWHYPFTTCLNCGPRYSISRALPYDREHTSMAPFRICDECAAEYNDVNNRRHYNQTNSCPDCTIPIHLYGSSKDCINSDARAILETIDKELYKGRIIAVKGIGGYLLLCDAGNEAAIHSLRMRKQRPAKPFALLYPSVELAAKDTELRYFEMAAMKDKVAPIVLCKLRTNLSSGLCAETVAPGLDKIGIMLPCSPLLQLIATTFNKPLVATSANISGSPIIYKDKDALQQLFELADYIVTYDREILAPQDDSVLQFTESGQQIILRRSRGLAPNYFPQPFTQVKESVLAMGAELKSAFTLLEENNLYISQYLGRQGTIEAEAAFKETLKQVTNLINAQPRYILIDKHPDYFVSQLGKDIAIAGDLPLVSIQHHKAHFGAVLAENKLINTSNPILGFIWDGTGYGDDGQVWGGEVFLYERGEMERITHLDYFPQLLGNKMSKEPRLAALSLLKHFPGKQSLIEKHFSLREWQYYQQLLLQPAVVLSSSMGRFLDGIAAILGICSHNTYEGEAAMQLEALARTCINRKKDYYFFPLKSNRLDKDAFLFELLEDIENGKDNASIAWKVFFSLVKMVEQVMDYYAVNSAAFSGGVFQNALLVDLLKENLPADAQLYFHRELSPNDECIGFGQLACFSVCNEFQPELARSMERKNNQQFEYRY